MKDVFEELEAEVAQCAVDRKHDVIDPKNLLIANDNLIAEFLSKEVFYVATKSELNVARFAEMHVANTSIEACCLALEAELATLRDKSHQENQRELIKHFSKLEAQNDLFMAENDKIKQHYKELYDSIKIIRAKHIEQLAHTPLIRKKQVTTTKPSDRQDSNKHKHVVTQKTQNTNVHVPPSTGVTSYLKASGSQPKSNPKTNRIPPAKGCSKHMTGDRSWLLNFVKKFIGTVRFGNDHFGAIMGYRDYVVGESVISRGSCGSNLYTISVEDMMKSSPICLLSKASKNKSWLWHRRLNHLNFGTINDLARKDLVRGLPRLKFKKDHPCSACQLGKSKKHTHKPKAKNTNLKVLNTLHMDLCGPMRVQTINGKKYILVIVDDYSRFTWVKFLRSKDETPDAVIKFITQIQVGLNKIV
nr:hypothetical protein [Tanacetum cinerariifolium]